MKHEAMIERPGQKVHPYSYRGETIRRRQVREEEGFPYLGGPKELELPQTQDWTFLRSKVPLHDWTTAPQVAPSPTFLGGRGHGLEDDSRTSRMTLPMMREELQHRLCSDWPGLRVVVSCTPQDLIQVAFDLNTADSERALLGYMNVLAKEADFLCTRGLRKVSQLWGVRRLVEELGQGAQNVNEWLLFLLTPKWVRMRPTDAYYTVHPRSSGSVFKMSAVGLSVMTSRDSDTVNEVRVRPSPGSVTRADKLDLLLLEKAASSLSTENSRQECPLQPGQGALPILKKETDPQTCVSLLELFPQALSLNAQHAVCELVATSAQLSGHRRPEQRADTEVSSAPEQERQATGALRDAAVQHEDVTGVDDADTVTPKQFSEVEEEVASELAEEQCARQHMSHYTKHLHCSPQSGETRSFLVSGEGLELETSFNETSGAKKKKMSPETKKIGYKGWCYQKYLEMRKHRTSWLKLPRRARVAVPHILRRFFFC